VLFLDQLDRWVSYLTSLTMLAFAPMVLFNGVESSHLAV